MRKTLERALDWSLGSVVGNLVWIGLTGLCAWVFNERTGLLATIIEFAGEHAQEFAAWTASAALVGALVGIFIRHRVALGQLAKKDAEIASLEEELAGRPAQEDVGELKRQLAAKDAEIESLRSPVESVRRTMASLPEDELALAGRLAEGPFRTSGFSAGLAHLESMGIANRQRVPGVFTTTWALTREAMSALAEDDGLKATVADALGRGLRDREAEEAIAAVIRRAPAATAGAISYMFDEGHFDYRAPDDDPWEARVDQGNRDLSEMESDGVIRYETLASGNRRWTLTENARRAIESDESLIGEGRAYVRAALGDGADEEGAGA